MKKLIVKLFLTTLFIVLLINMTFINLNSFAEIGDFIIVPKDSEVYLYNSNEIKLFKLPSTYYVKYVDDGNNIYYHINYKDVDGYVKKTEFTSQKKQNVENPYYNDVLIKPKNTGIYLETKPNTDSLNRKIINTTDNLTFISYIEDTQKNVWYYVKSNSDYGYVLSTETNNTGLKSTMDQSIHQDSVVNNDTGNNENTNTNINNPNANDTSNNLLNFALAIGIAIPTIILIVMIFKPQNGNSKNNRKNYRNNNRNYDYDDRNYYDDRMPRR
jgi:hypothetical protein